MSKKYCVVPLCYNSTVKTPNKLFFPVPKDSKSRERWMTVMRVTLGPTSVAFCCEDHFDMPLTPAERQKKYIEKLKREKPEKYEIKRKQHLQKVKDRQKKAKDLIDEAKRKANKNAGPGQVAEDEAKVCRTCLATGVRMVDVAAAGLQDTFQHITGTKLHTSDERPTQVCYVCCSQLQRFRAFCHMSRRAETFITKLVRKGLQISEQTVSKHHHLIKPNLNVKKNPLITIRTQEDTDECVTVEQEVKVEVDSDVEQKDGSDSLTESDNEIRIEVQTGTYMSEICSDREYETEEKQPDWETGKEIKIERDEIDIEEFDPLKAVKHTIVKDETCYCMYCAESFLSQSELLKHIQTHTQKKPKEAHTTSPNVKDRLSKRNVKTKLESQCKFCNKIFAVRSQLVTHVAKKHGLGEFSQAQKPKRRKPNILEKRAVNI